MCNCTSTVGWISGEIVMNCHDGSTYFYWEDFAPAAIAIVAIAVLYWMILDGRKEDEKNK